MSTVVDDENPEVDIKFPGGTLTLSTWREIKQLDFVRHCLQSGFLAQMSNNETLQDIFGADADILMDMENNKMGKVDKRLLMSKNSEQNKTNKNFDKKEGQQAKPSEPIFGRGLNKIKQCYFRDFLARLYAV